MNYRHAFHAGNFADCMKHALLVWLLRAMLRKDTPFLVLDTHAGTGFTDLDGQEARRTGEADRGIRRLLRNQGKELGGDAAPQTPAFSALAAAFDIGIGDYLCIVRQLGLYPGSPAIARALLRPNRDRLVCCELHPEDAAALRRRFAHDASVGIHKRDGYEALTALLPPPERRGLILIDPPYEAPDEFDRLAAGLRTAHVRFATGVFAAWYPIKHRAPVRAFHAALHASGMRDIVAAELLLREPLDAARLNGCGLLVINPPWRFEKAAQPILSALLEVLGDGEPGAGTALLRLAPEAGP